jgi:hypothetical protein
LVVEIECAYGAPRTTLTGVTQEGKEVYVDGVGRTRVCDVVVQFDSPSGCALSQLSWGWLFIALLLSIMLLYLVLGTFLTFANTGILQYPNERWWRTRFGEARVGRRVLRRACRKRRCILIDPSDCMRPAFCCELVCGAWSCLSTVESRKAAARRPTAPTTSAHVTSDNTASPFVSRRRPK